MRNNLDWTEIDLEALPEDFIPRTSYQPNPDSAYDRDYGEWFDLNGTKKPQRDFYRVAWRRMAATTGERTLHVAVMPPQATHLNTIYTAWHDEGGTETTLLLVGILTSIVSDFLVKVGGVSDIRSNTIGSLPTVTNQPIASAIKTRTIALTCLSSAFEELAGVANVDSLRVPVLRREEERRSALVELDVLVALDLGVSIDELCIIYRTQFPVLRGYEEDDLYDANGRQLPNAMNKLYRTVGEEGMTLEDRTWVHPQSEVEYVFDFPFKGVDREEDMRVAYKKFSRMLEKHGRIIEEED